MNPLTPPSPRPVRPSEGANEPQPGTTSVPRKPALALVFEELELVITEHRDYLSRRTRDCEEAQSKESKLRRAKEADEDEIRRTRKLQDYYTEEIMAEESTILLLEELRTRMESRIYEEPFKTLLTTNEPQPETAHAL